MKLYLVTFEIRNGDREYVSTHVTQASTLQSAENKAKRYAKSFWLERGVKEEDGGYYRHDHSEFISVEGVEEITPDELVKRLSI